MSEFDDLLVGGNLPSYGPQGAQSTLNYNGMPVHFRFALPNSKNSHWHTASFCLRAGVRSVDNGHGQLAQAVTCISMQRHGHIAPATSLYAYAGLDTDVLMLVYVLDTSVSEELCDFGTVAAAQPYLFEKGTGRTMVGLMLICSLFGRLDADIMVLAHEISHALVFHPALINNFPAYAPGGVLSGESPVAQEAGGKTYIATPQVRFGCMRTKLHAQTRTASSVQTCKMQLHESSLFLADRWLMNDTLLRV